MPFCARPSMVVTLVPTAPLTGKEQERIATPSTWTVQAPHCAMPQPYLVPVRPTFSRIAQSSGVSGSTSTSKVLPLIVRFAIAYPLISPIHRLNFEVMLDRKLEQFKSRTIQIKVAVAKRKIIDLLVLRRLDAATPTFCYFPPVTRSTM